MIVVVAGLIVPGLLIAAWAVLQFGGVVEDQRKQERDRAEAVLLEVAARARRALRERASTAPLIRLDAAGRPAGPFVPMRARPTALPKLQARPAALAVAVDLELGAHGEGALAFFDRALPVDQRWDMTSRLAYARALAGHADDLVGAIEMLLASSPPDGDDGPLPWPVVRDMTIARIRVRDGDPAAVIAFARRVVSHEYAIPAEAARPIGDWIESQVEGGVPGLASWLLLAEAFVGMERGWLSPNRELASPGDPWLVVRAEGVLVLSQDTVAAVLDDILAESARQSGDVTLVAKSSDALARGVLPPLGRPIAVIPAGTLASERLSDTARLLLTLAGLAFLLGNVMAWRLVRREAAVSRLKSEFIDTVSHELRTPLTALTLKAEMLESGDVPDAKRDAYVSALYDETRRLGRLVERVLDFSRIERGRERLTLEEVPARRLLARGVKEARRLVLAAGQRLRIEVPRGLPLIRADEEILTRALRNLLENAAKYAPSGTDVTLRAVDSGGHVAFEVRDQGPGVPASHRKSIWDPFERLHRPGTRRTSGSGLGLALVARAAEVHGGSVEFTEPDGGGAVFRINLPALRTESDAA